MRISDLQREENYNEYLRLLQDDDYLDVTYDIESGGVSAVHRLHKFDKQMGPFGCRRGDYEIQVVSVLRANGFRVLLESEESPFYAKNNDGLLNDSPMDIKTIESRGVWSISTKLRESEKQGANVVILYFPTPTLYSIDRVLDGISKYENNPQIHANKTITDCLVIVEDRIVNHLKKTTTPSVEWF